MSDVIAISFNSMNEAKINLNRAREACENTKNKLNSAISKLQVDSSSARLRQSQDSIREQVNRVNKRMDNINRVVAGINYAVKRFHEVDDKCANRIKGAVGEYSKKNNKQSAIQKFGNFCGSLVDDGKKAWSNMSNKIDSTKKTVKKWSHNAANFAGDNWKNILFIAIDVAAIIGSIVIIVVTAPVSVPLLLLTGAAILFSVSSLVDEGIKIHNKETTGKEGTGFNFLEEGFKEPFKLAGIDEKYGEYLFNTTDFVTAFGLPALATGKVAKSFSALVKAGNEARAAKDLAEITRNGARVANRRLTHAEIDEIAHNKYITKRALEASRDAFNRRRIEAIKEISSAVWDENKKRMISGTTEKGIEFITGKDIK